MSEDSGYLPGQSWFATATHGAFGTYLVEIKDLGFKVDALPLTDIDKANGIAWKGQARIGGKMFRYYRDGQWEMWQAWDDGDIPDTALLLVRTQQNWMYEFQTSLGSTLKMHRNVFQFSHLLIGVQCP